MSWLLPELSPGTGTSTSRMVLDSECGICILRAVPKENHGEGHSEQQAVQGWAQPPLADSISVWRHREQRLLPAVSCSVCLPLSQPGKFISFGG